VYRAAVLAAQQALRRAPAPSLAALRCFLADFQARWHQTGMPSFA